MPIIHTFFIDTIRKVKYLAELDIEHIVNRLEKNGVKIDIENSSKRSVTFDFGTKLQLRERFTKKEIRFAQDIKYNILTRDGFKIEITNSGYHDGFGKDHIGILSEINWPKHGRPLKRFEIVENLVRKAYEETKKRQMATVIPFPYITKEAAEQKYAAR